MNVLEFEDQYMQYLMFDEPIPFKNLLIYPITMKDYMIFSYYVKSIIIDKNNIPDAKIISMPYLEFMIYNAKRSEEGKLFYAMMLLLLCLCLKIDIKNISIIESNNDKPKIKILLNDKNILINYIDFDEIRRIICYLNNIDLPEDNDMNPEIKKAIEATIEFKRKHEDKMGSIEHQINYLIANTTLTKEDIKNMSIRSFSDVLSIKDYSFHYNAMLNGEYSGMVEFKTKPKNPLCDLRPKDKYESYISDYNQVKDKIDKVS